MLGGGGEVDVVDADAGAADDLEAAGGGLEDLAADLGGAADNEGVAEGDLGAELLLGEVVGAIDVGELAEELDAGVVQLLGDKDGGLRRGGDGEDGKAAAEAAEAVVERRGSGEGEGAAGGGRRRWRRRGHWIVRTSEVGG